MPQRFRLPSKLELYQDADGAVHLTTPIRRMDGRHTRRLQTMKKVLEVLPAGGAPAAKSALYAAAPFPRSTIEDALRDLIAEGKVVRLVGVENGHHRVFFAKITSETSELAAKRGLRVENIFPSDARITKRFHDAFQANIDRL